MFFKAESSVRTDHHTVGQRVQRVKREDKQDQQGDKTTTTTTSTTATSPISHTSLHLSPGNALIYVCQLLPNPLKKGIISKTCTARLEHCHQPLFSFRLKPVMRNEIVLESASGRLISYPGPLHVFLV